jgi:ATP-binding cassette subfamily F protein uup
LTDHLFIFEGDGKVRDYYGSYTTYSFEKASDKQANDNRIKTETKQVKPVKTKIKTKLSFNEKREYESLEKEIEQLEEEKAKAESIMNSGIQDYEELNRLSARVGELIQLIDKKTMRWMELDEFTSN